jgi:ribonuclease VapC
LLVVDASALLAMLLDEPEALAFRDALLSASGAVISPVNLWETALRVRTVKGEAGTLELDGLLARLKVQVAPTTEAQTWAAIDAAKRFGRGTPARLNLGDCFAYALASVENLPLLYKGDDFPLTDVRSAL